MATPAEDSPPTAGSDVRGLWRQVAYLFRSVLALRNLEVRPPGAGKLIWGGENVVLEITPAPAGTGGGAGLPAGVATRTVLSVMNGALTELDIVVVNPPRRVD